MYAATGLPARLLLPVLQHLRVDIAEMREAIVEVHIHTRMVGGSHLVVYEADWERVEEGLVYPLHHNHDNIGILSNGLWLFSLVFTTLIAFSTPTGVLRCPSMATQVRYFHF